MDSPEIAPDTTVYSDKRFIDNGRIILSAGISAASTSRFMQWQNCSAKSRPAKLQTIWNMTGSRAVSLAGTGKEV